MSAAPPVKRARQAAWRAGVSLGRTVARPTAGTRPLPDYLIVGGQRCGTTSLHHYLVQHPGVLPARFTKGVHWFDVAFDKPESWYRANFPTAVAAPRRGRAARPSRRHRRGEPLLPVPSRGAGSGGCDDARREDHRGASATRSSGPGRTTTTSATRGFEDLDFEAALDAENEPSGGSRGGAGRAGWPPLLPPAPRIRRPRAIRGAAQSLGTPRSCRSDHWCSSRPTSKTTPQATMARVHRFLGLPEAPTATDRSSGTSSRTPSSPMTLQRPPAGRVRWRATRSSVTYSAGHCPGPRHADERPRRRES